jgi:hypothetical protein
MVLLMLFMVLFLLTDAETATTEGQTTPVATLG